MKRKVGWWEDSHAVLVVARSESTLYDELSSELYLLTIDGLGAHVQLVVNASDCAMCRRREVAGKQLRKRNLVHALGLSELLRLA